MVDIAEACGISYMTLSRLERGTHRPSYDTALALSRWLGWTTDQVMEAAEKPALHGAGVAVPVPRLPWGNFPEVWIHSPEPTTKSHSCYLAAKSGSADDAAHLVRDLVSMHQIDALRQRFPSQRPVLVSAHAYEREGVNAIPEALAELLANILGWPVDSGLVQVNVVGHTGADGFGRLARQPSFSGWVQPGKNYLMVDDFVGMGGTLANLRGYIEASGGHVLGATVLTGKPRSAKLTLEGRTLQELRRKHGAALEDWWEGRFGHSFDALTESEAGYLLRTPDAESIRNRVIAAEQAGDRGKVR